MEYTRDNDPRIATYIFKTNIPKWVMTNEKYKNYLFIIGDFERLKEFKQNRQREINNESSHNRHR